MELNLGFLGFLFLIATLLLPMAQSSSPCDFPIPTPTATCSKYLPPPTPIVYNFTVDEVNCSRYCNDGPILTVNGRLPGPTIVVRKNKDNSPVNVTVNVVNNGPTGITIHWHGVRQPSNPWHDGPENITQCPIPAQGNFTQNIIITHEVGTLLWHAHSDWSRATVHGAIVILPAFDEDTHYQYDCEQTIVLASWYKNVSAEYEKTANHIDPDDAEAYTINGYVGKSDNTTKCNDTYDEPMFIVPVAPSKTYLLRIINAVMNEQMFFSIANHSLTVVGIDGAYVKNITMDYIVIGAGNTIDVLVTTTDNLSGANYYMAARQYTNGVKQISTTTTAAILQYTTNASADPFFPDDTLPDVKNYTKAEAFLNQIKSYEKQDVPSNTTGTFKRYFTNVAVYPGDNFAATISNFGFVLPSVDLLNTSAGCISSGEGCDEIEAFPATPGTITHPLSYKTAAIVVEHNDVVELVLQGAASGAEDHPFHVHGHSFYLLARAFNTTFNDTTDVPLYDLDFPPLLNTVEVPYQGWAVIRFRADNPGVWFIHCHLDRHSVWGMATALIVKESEDVKMGTRPSYMPACTAPATASP